MWNLPVSECGFSVFLALLRVLPQGRGSSGTRCFVLSVSYGEGSTRGNDWWQAVTRKKYNPCLLANERSQVRDSRKSVINAVGNRHVGDSEEFRPW